MDRTMLASRESTNLRVRKPADYIPALSTQM